RGVVAQRPGGVRRAAVEVELPTGLLHQARVRRADLPANLQLVLVHVRLLARSVATARGRERGSGRGIRRAWYGPRRGPMRLLLLGELEVEREGRAQALPPSRKTRALLGYLALTGR